MQLKRELYDMSHWSMTVGRIGRLQTLCLLPVIAGDSVRLNLNAVFRLSPLRRNMYLDAHIDLFAFYVPHRHIYSNWIDFIKEGINENETLGTRTLTGSLYCCGTHLANGTVPKWVPEGYINIYNRYFKNPTATDYALSFFDSLSEGDDSLYYGISCGHMPRAWNTGVVALTVAGDRRIALVDTDKIDLLDFAAKQGQLESVRQREFFARRYVDVLDIWGGFANTDADQRPTLLMHKESWLSGYDVDGTGDANLGEYKGKGQAVGSMTVPQKFIPEHGAIWLMALVRFPAVHIAERHYLMSKQEPTYLQIAGDPELLRQQPPMTADLRDWFFGATLADAGQIPYGQWYREQPNYVHHSYGLITGHPFLEEVITSYASQVEVISGSEYDNVFSTMSLAHWQAQGHIDCTIKRVVCDPKVSIFAGSV